MLRTLTHLLSYFKFSIVKGLKKKPGKKKKKKKIPLHVLLGDIQ